MNPSSIRVPCVLTLFLALLPSASSPGAATAIELEIREALAGPARTDRERARDGARQPAETLAFFGLRDDATVVELRPAGGGYYTAILAPVLAPRMTLKFVTP